MKYYEVFVATQAYHGHEALTYASGSSLSPGHVVRVPLRRGQVLGVIWRSVPKPMFAVKGISDALTLPPLPAETIQLLLWIQSYYPSALGPTVQLFLPKLLSEKLINNRLVEPAPNSKSLQAPALTSEQKYVLSTIREQGTYLLHGVTGSGKTRVYIELIQRAIQAGRSAMILVPEISLTSQLLANLQQYFNDRLVVIHSHLTDAQRRNAWLRILTADEPLVLLGPRSVLFSPVKNLGMAIIDEAHEPAYKQEQSPHYHGVRVAAQLASLHKATLVLGSATPGVTDYYIAQQRNIPILRMHKLALGNPAPLEKTVIDLRDRSHFTRNPHISNQLIAAIGEALARSEQCLLYLNRRGTARVILCQTCGWEALCPHCDLRLTYHGDTHSIHCHVCGYIAESPQSCPICNGADILFRSIGTKALVTEVQRLFPKARIGRYDTDNKKSENFHEQYEAILAGKIDILVGTQTLAKGLDLPRLSVLGVVVADSSLILPDFTVGERTFQLISQVVGRIGRGHIAGQAFVQTYQPDNPVIKAALKGDWENFYSAEIEERRQFLYPPFSFLLKLTCRRTSSNAAQTATAKFAASLRGAKLKIEVNGPSPAFHERVSGHYQWQLVIKARQRGELLKVIAMLPSGWSYDIDPADLL